MKIFGTKAETLQNLSQIIKNAMVLPIVIIKVDEWENNTEKVLCLISKMGFFDTTVVVRSSCTNEDSFEDSMAGKYTSMLNICGKENIINAINIVIDSYKTRGGGNLDNQVFIQPMLKNVDMSGVVFSIDPNTGGNYIVINYDDITGLTDTITSGNTNNTKSFYYFRKSNIGVNDYFSKIINLVLELENLLDNVKLDIEFAIDKNGILYLLQVRPLCLNCNIQDIDEQEKLLNRMYNKIELLQGNKLYLYGDRTVFGVMPDWNPAEIIGIKPRPLALSLYKELVTDTIWAYQRDNYGYKNLRSFPLVISLSGMPYIDVRVSFNSFLPKQLEDSVCEKLINYYIDRFVDKPENHDKVEFEIVYSCYTFDIKEKVNTLYNYGFNKFEIASICDSLRFLTNKIIDKNNGLLTNDLNKINKLEARRENILNSSLDTVSKIYWLLEDCRRYGTLPFAGIARSAFVSVQMLKSLININVISTEEYQQYIRSLDTVSSDLNNDYIHLNREEFLKKYGHLRPGTYDILSPRYDEQPERYFDFDKSLHKIKEDSIEKNSFKLSLNQLNEIKRLLEEHNINCDVLELFEFFKIAIEGREYSKFVFTKSLSDALVLFKNLVVECGFSEEDSSYCNMDFIKELYSTDKDIKELLYASIQEGRIEYERAKGIDLPIVILEANDVFRFNQLQCMPNYITLKKVIGKNVCIDKDIENIDNCIVCIKSADPGYDWIFSRNIIGFITMYGGVNSHMAIRAGELGIPAVIGTGEELYNKVKKSKTIEIDCLEKVVRTWE